MASGGSFSVQISAKDSASGTLNSINARLSAFNKEAARSAAPFQQLQTNLAKMAGNTGLSTVASGMQAVARHSLDAFRSVTRIIEPLAAISGAASVAGMYKLATAFATFGTALGQAAARAGLSAEMLHKLENAGRLAGVSAEAVASGMTTLRDNMVHAQGGQAPQVIGMLQALGLSASDAGRFAKDTTKALPELADKIAGIKDPALQAQAATALFGGAGEALLPFLRKGSVGIGEYTEKARRYGVMNGEAATAANRLREAQTGLQLAVEGLGNSIAQKVAPYIGPLVDKMAEWVAHNREWISQGIGDAVGKFATWISGVDWAGVATSIGNIFTSADHVAHALGGWVTVGEGLIAFFGVAFMAKMLAPIIAIGGALAKLPLAAAAAAVKANVELEKIGKGKGVGGGLPGMLGTGLTALGLAESLSAGTTEEDRHKNNTEGFLPWFGGALGGLLGMKFDANGNSPGLFGGGGPSRSMFGGFPGAHGVAGSIAHQVATGQGPNGAAVPLLPPVPKATQEQWNTDMRQLMGYGWKKEQAAGILGNFDQESRGRHNITGDGQQAYGLGQWHPDRQANFQRVFGHNISQSTHAEQIQFADWELHHTEKAAGDRLQQQTTYAGSASTVRQFYERPLNATGQEDAWRTARAQRIIQGFDAAGPERNLPAGAGTASNPGAPAAGGGTINGQIQVGVNVSGPPGTAITSTQTGQNLAPLKISRSTVGFMGLGTPAYG